MLIASARKSKTLEVYFSEIERLIRVIVCSKSHEQNLAKDTCKQAFFSSDLVPQGDTNLTM